MNAKTTNQARQKRRIEVVLEEQKKSSRMTMRFIPEGKETEANILSNRTSK